MHQNAVLSSHSPYVIHGGEVESAGGDSAASPIFDGQIMTGESEGSKKGEGSRTGRLSLRFGSEPQKSLPAQQVRVRALPNEEGEQGRMLLLEAQVGTSTTMIQLTASEAAELMFEIGFALEEAARMANGLPPRRPT